MYVEWLLTWQHFTLLATCKSLIENCLLCICGGCTNTLLPPPSARKGFSLCHLQSFEVTSQCCQGITCTLQQAKSIGGSVVKHAKMKIQ